MSTALLTTRGTRHDDGSIHLSGHATNPMTGEAVPNRFVWTFGEDGSEQMVAYETHDGVEIMTMRMTLTGAYD